VPPTKVLFTIGSLDLGGAERHLALIAPRLKQLGFEPTIYCISRRGVQADEIERAGVAVIGPPWESGPHPTQFGKLFRLFASCLKLLRILIAERPQIAHFFLPLAYLIGVPLAWLTRVPTMVMSRRSLNLYQAQHPILARFERLLHPRMNAVLANSRAVFDQLVDLEGCERGKVRVIYNGVDLAGIAQAPQPGPDGTPARAVVLIIVANLIPYKGHNDLLEALGAVRGQMPDGWTLQCVGRDDGIRSGLETQVQRLGLGGHVLFLGERTDVASLLKGADIGILCSHQEGFANAILEGMAAGLPIVATDVGGNSESVVHGQTGLIVPPRNPAALGQAVLSLVSDPAARERMGEAGRKRAYERFSIESCVDQYAVLYRSLTERNLTLSAARPWRLKEGLVTLSRSRPIRFAALFAITVVTFGFALSAVDFGTVWASTRDLSGLTILAISGALLLGSMLATIRFWYMASDIGHHLSLRDAMIALGAGQIAGALTIQFFGQIAARSILLGPQRLSPPANILLATYERFIAAAVSVTFATTGAWYLFGKVAIDWETGGNEFVRILLGLASALGMATAFGWGKIVLRTLPNIPRRTIAASLLRTVVLTAFIQLCTMAAYVIAARAVAPTIPLSNLCASAAVVAFAASLPISFAGWGVRELSAVVILGMVGLQSGAALTVSILMGSLSLMAVIFIAMASLLIPTRSVTIAVPSVDISDRIDVVRIMQRGIPLLTATAVLFQIHVPVGATLLNVNLADPMAILGGALFFFYFVFRGTPRWRLSWLNGHVVVATAVVLLAFLHGYYAFGWSDWAFTNKMLGWFVLLSYGATGALIVTANRGDLPLLLRAFVGGCTGIVLLELTLLLLNVTIGKLPQGWISLPLDGFSHNRNAFAFVLLLAICCTSLMPLKVRHWILGIMLGGLWYAGSRASWGVVLILLPVAVYLHIFRIHTVVFGIVIGVAISALIILAPFLISSLLSIIIFPAPEQIIIFPAPEHLHIWNTIISPSSSDTERFTSILGGLRLFIENPFFGAGLGGYIATTTNAARPVIIHSTPVWLLAEMGLIGFLAISIPALRIFWTEWKRPQRDIAAKLLLVILVVFAIESSIHEMLYQRSIWLLLGALLAYVPRIASNGVAQHIRTT
jgi:glycosyltransferase involved in cell wall biosynthesis